ncbi:NAD(P)H-dependent glycerol-3-phosphate dehydrogenase [Microlunatus ginsengisoli]|uniref:Glycerol-3-phosphate dehydrogenase [NAD(P)+] n=1 Tax=Microlunatus ginsengisoli TaxID=363863 RepID=A0ABP7AXP2_9ACTN
MTSTSSTAAAPRTKVAVMGAGSWGTAFSLVLADAGCEVALWSHHADQAEAINRERINSAFFPDLELPDAIRAYADAQQAMEGARFVVLAIPSQALRENLARWVIPAEAAVVSLAKGIELGTGLRMSQLIAEVTQIPSDRIAVVSGPNLAREIAERQPAATVVACASEDTATALQRVCHTARFRAYTNTDVIGVELGGATKNVIALAVGMAVGFGLGDNSTASVITRGLAETIRLGDALGAHPYTFSGLAGLGDLVATCSSPLSRNRTFGEGLGRGRTVAEIAASTRQVAEGVKSCSSIRQLARDHGVEMPIVEAVDAVIAEQLTPRDMIEALMSRSAKPERY